jgi:hypothetical protein
MRPEKNKYKEQNNAVKKEKSKEGSGVQISAWSQEDKSEDSSARNTEIRRWSFFIYVLSNCKVNNRSYNW